MFRYIKVFMVGVAALSAAPLGAQDITFNGQLRPRYEARDPEAGTGLKDFTSMRMRASIRAALENDVVVFIQLQDVRLFGEELNTLTDFRADNFDMHQGYVQLFNLQEDHWGLRVGRQEMNLGGQRLVGAVGWAQQGRSFDGIRVRTERDWGWIDFFGYKTRELGAQPTSLTDSEFFGAYGTLDLGEGLGDLDLYGMYQLADVGTDETKQGTFGARYVRNSENLHYRIEGSFQTGDRLGEEVSAYMFGARVGLDVADDKATVTLWYDYLSGDDDPGDGETKVFDTMFATNHKFYGFADLFLNIPAHTGGLGLQDMAIKLAYRPEGPWSFGADLHSFRVAEEGSLSGTHLGEEIDLTGTYRYSSNATIQGGLSYIAQDDPWGELGRLSENMWWGYVMLNVTF